MREVVRKLNSDATFDGMKSVERVKNVMSCCPREIQVNLSNAKVKNYLWEYATVERAMNEGQQAAISAHELLSCKLETNEDSDTSDSEQVDEIDNEGEQNDKMHGLLLQEANKKFKCKIKDWPVYATNLPEHRFSSHSMIWPKFLMKHKLHSSILQHQELTGT